MTVATDQDFQEKVTNSKGVTLVDFWAEWCTPCHMLTPTLEEISTEMKDKGVQIVKLNVDENPGTGNMFGIMSLPTMLIFKDGVVRGQLVGVQPKGAIVSMIERVQAA